MKYIKPSLLAAWLFTGQPLMAANDSLIPDDVKNYIGYGAIMLTLVVVIVALLVVLRSFQVLTMLILKAQGYTTEQIKEEMAGSKTGKSKKPKESIINRVLSLRPLSEEKNLLIPHAYDGIQELDNPTPGWFMYLFYGTITFGICYMLIYHVFGFGQLQYGEYRTEVAIADKAKKEFLSKAANQVDENSVKLVTDAQVISSGMAIFKVNCVPCHGDKGQGVVGPNLTDDYWLHGGKINEVFKTIKYGVLSKGMPTWEKQLTPKQISDVANYVESLRGTNPPGAKEAQGVKENNASSVSAKSTVSVKPKAGK